ncbi:MAG: hypothetical protein HC917_06395 [Richelia sp. SM2_1_7]|nr:hypothetical protein [Richelia sp. SM2_1_7]
MERVPRLGERSLVQDYISSHIRSNNNNGLIDVACRVGKSKIVLDALYEPLIIIAPYSNILESWKKEFDKWRYDYPVITSTFASIKNLESANYTLIIDEIQQLSEAQINKLKTLKFKRILGLSGTLSPTTKIELRKHLGLSTLIKYDIDEAIRDSIINDYKIILHPLSLDNKSKYIRAGNDKNRFFSTEYNDYSYKTKIFNKAAFNANNAEPKDKERLHRFKMMCAKNRASGLYTYESKLRKVEEFRRNKNNYILYTTLKDNTEYFGNPYHTSSEDNLTKFINKELSYVSVIHMASMGISIPHCNTIIFHQIQSNPEIAVQKAMRACMLEGKTEEADIHIFYYKDTQDEVWVNKALEGFNQDKLIWVS